LVKRRQLAEEGGLNLIREKRLRCGRESVKMGVVLEVSAKGKNAIGCQDNGRDADLRGE